MRPRRWRRSSLPGRADGIAILARGAHLVQQLQPQDAVGGEVDGERLLLLFHVSSGLLQRQRQVAQLLGEGPRRVLLGGVEQPLATRALQEKRQASSGNRTGSLIGLWMPRASKFCCREVSRMWPLGSGGR